MPNNLTRKYIEIDFTDNEKAFILTQVNFKMHFISVDVDQCCIDGRINIKSTSKTYKFSHN